MDNAFSQYTVQRAGEGGTLEVEIILDADASVTPPSIPTVIPSTTDATNTPLPLLPMTVLSIVMLGEFLSSNVSTPFLLFMVEEFGSEDAAEAALRTGILVSTFFLTQFMTSLIWATLADKYGRRFVLVVTLLGSAVSVAAFGSSKTLTQAICIRSLQGVFAGAVGVARGSVIGMTDASNEGRAYAILGFFWGFGGLLGPILGGSLEHPTVRWPVLSQWTFMVEFPYFLPCTTAGAILLAGSILACFLGPDGGPRNAPLHTHPDKIKVISPLINSSEQLLWSTPLPVSRSLHASPRRTISHKSSDYFATTNRMESGCDSAIGSPSSYSTTRPSDIKTEHRTLTVSSVSSTPRSQRSSIFSYGRSSEMPIRSLTLANSQLTAVENRITVLNGNVPDSRDHSVNDEDDAPDVYVLESTRSIGERLVMANENAVNNIADLWVAAALSLDESPFVDDDASEIDNINDEDLMYDGHRGRRNSVFNGDRRSNRRFSSVATRSSNQLTSTSRHPSFASPSSILPSDGSSVTQAFEGSSSFLQMPTIFVNTGLSTLPAVLDHHGVQSESDLVSPPERDLSPILESRRPSTVCLERLESIPLLNKPSSPSSQLPLLVILQFGMLALHTTTHDQVFMSYLVTDYDAGGLNLTAGDFAQLIALMGIAQIVYQFYLYPNVGPPRGRLSHLTMFRLGTVLFIPAYLTVVLYRVPLAHGDGLNKLPLKTALAISTAVRYCAITFSFTSISVLLNFLSPPDAVGFANGLAQTAVSLARFLGPMLGGWLWSASVEGHASGYPIGFVVCASMCGFAVLATFQIK